jgi:hypothetical protein
MNVRANDILFVEGDPGDRMYIVRAGKVRVLKRSGQQIQVLSELGPGSFFGEMSLLDNSPRSATVQALEDSELAVVDQEALEQTLRSQPSWLSALLRVLTSRLRDTTSHKIQQDRVRSFSTLLWCALAENQLSPAGVGLAQLFDRMRILTGLDDLSIHKLICAFCQLGLGTLHEEGQLKAVVVRSEKLLQLVYAARLAREQNKPAPGWLLSAGEQRILTCWAETARLQGVQDNQLLSVPYAAFMATLQSHTPGVSLGIAALSRMEKHGILRIEAPKNNLKANYEEILEILESQSILARMNSELSVLIENC